MGCVYSMQKDNLSQALWKVILQRLRALSIREPHLVYHRSLSIKFACAYLLQSGSAHAYHEHVCWLISYHVYHSLRGKCPNTELFLVQIFLCSDWIRWFTYGVISGPYFPVFSPNTGKFGPEMTPYLDPFHAMTAYVNKIYSLTMRVLPSRWPHH